VTNELDVGLRKTLTELAEVGTLSRKSDVLVTFKKKFLLLDQDFACTGIELERSQDFFSLSLKAYLHTV